DSSSNDRMYSSIGCYDLTTSSALSSAAHEVGALEVCEPLTVIVTISPGSVANEALISAGAATAASIVAVTTVEPTKSRSGSSPAGAVALAMTSIFASGPMSLAWTRTNKVPSVYCVTSMVLIIVISTAPGAWTSSKLKAR